MGHPQPWSIPPRVTKKHRDHLRASALGRHAQFCYGVSGKRPEAVGILSHASGLERDLLHVAFYNGFKQGSFG